MPATDSPHSPDQALAPRAIWRLLLAGGALIGLLVLGGAVLIALGFSDPPSAAYPAWTASDWDWTGGPAVTLPARAERWLDAPVSLPTDGTAFTLDVRAALDAGSDPGAAWGVWIETRDGARIVYALSGDGMITTRRCPAGARPAALEDCPALRPEWRWTLYPRVHPLGDANRIELHRESPGHVRFRLNRERLGLAALDPAGPWGVWLRGGRAGSATLRGDAAALYLD